MSLKYNEITGEFENIEDSLPLHILHYNWSQLIKIGNITLGKTTVEDLSSYKFEWEFCGVRITVDGISFWSTNDQGIIDTIYFDAERCGVPNGTTFLKCEDSHSIIDWRAIIEQNGLEILDVDRTNTSYSLYQELNYVKYEAKLKDCNLRTVFILKPSDIDIWDDEKETVFSYKSMTIYTDVHKIPDFLEWLQDDGRKYIKISEDKTSIISCDKMAKGIVVIPDGIVTIAQNAFKDCNLITEVIFPKGLRRIESYSFWNCRNLAVLNFPDSLLYIGSNAFQGCKNIKELLLNNGLQEIENSAFSSSKLLSNVQIPESVSKIGVNAFPCRIEVNPGNRYIKIIDDFVYTVDNDLIYIPEFIEQETLTLNIQTKSIGTFSFFAHPKIKQLILNDGIISINDLAFCFAFGLEELHISNSVRTIGRAFLHQCNIKRLYLHIDDPEICDFSEHAFLSFDKTKCELYVPENSLHKYRANPLFEDFCYIHSIKSKHRETIVHTISRPGNRQFYNRYDKIDTTNTNFLVGEKVSHPKFENGVVEKVEGEGTHQKVLINFEKYGRKLMMVSFAKLRRI